MKMKTYIKYSILGCVLYLSISFSIYYYINKKAYEHPILLWWTDFALFEQTITCSNNKKCLISGNLEHINHNKLKALLFYGSQLDLKNMPKNHDVLWALFHEESPKNLPALRTLKLQQLFNITSTFNRHSTFPIPLQYLESLELLMTDEFFLPVQYKDKLIKDRNLAPILYIQSACDTPMNRDSYVKELMQYIKIDSYGICLNNKKLPKGLTAENGTLAIFSDALLDLTAKYKFIIAIENAKCEDYVTEKFWRPLMAGSIPIYMGATTIKDFLPNPKSALLMEDYPSIKALADHITALNNNAELYNDYLDHKLKRQIMNEYLHDAYKSGGSYGFPQSYYDVIPAFQCFICESVHANRVFVPNKENVYNCEYPEDRSWHFSWKQGENDAEQYLLDRNKNNN